MDDKLILRNILLVLFLFGTSSLARAENCPLLDKFNHEASQIDVYLKSADFIPAETKQNLSKHFSEIQDSVTEFQASKQYSCSVIPGALINYIESGEDILSNVPGESAYLSEQLLQAQEVLDIEAANKHMDSNLRCSRLFQLFGKQIGMDVVQFPEWKEGNKANDIAKVIQNDSAHWEKINSDDSGKELQDLAEQGYLVVGVYDASPAQSSAPVGSTKSTLVPMGDSGEPGHIAIVMPVAAGVRMLDYQSKGPFVVDGDHYVSPRRDITAAGFEASFHCGISRGNYSFNSKKHAPTWYKWKLGQIHQR